MQYAYCGKQLTTLMNQFVFILKDSTQKAFNTFFWFLFFLHLVITAVIITNTADPFQKKCAIVTFTFLIIATVLFYFFKSKFKLYSYQLAMFVAMVTFWIIQSAWLPAIICAVIIAFVLKVLSIKSTATFTTADIIIVKSVFKKKYEWGEIDNVVLKDGLLSIDLKNNHLMQVEIIDKNTSEDELLFNQFCRHQLKTINSKL